MSNDKDELAKLRQRIAELEKIERAHKEAEDALKVSEERYRILVESQAEGLGIVDREEAFIFANPAAHKIFGVSPGKLIGRNIKEFTDPEKFQMIKSQTEIRKRGERSTYDIEIVRPDGEKRVLLVTASPRFDAEGKFAGAFGIFRDITERKKAEVLLRESEEKWRSLMENVPDIIMNVDRDGTIRFINRTVPGITPEKTIGTSVYDYIPEEYHETIRTSIESVFQTGEPSQYELSGVGPHGKISWYSSRIGPIKRKGEVIAVTIIATDVSERKRAEEALKESEVKIRALLNAIPDMMFLFNKDGVFLDFISAKGDEPVLQPGEFLGKKITEVLPEDLSEQTLYYINKALQTNATQIFEYQLPVPFPDGEMRDYEARIVASGENEIVAIVRDITEVARIAKIKKDFVDNISHELRTPLTAIKGFVETLEDEKGESKRYLEIIKKHTDRLINIVNGLLTLSSLESSDKLELEEIDLKTIAEGVSKIFEQRLKEKKLLYKLYIEDDLPVIQGDSFKLEQVFINVIDNAINYTDEGEIRVSIRKESGRVKIEIQDTGIGISPDHLQRIFERFYVVDKSRSKKFGGTGLGLSIVKHIVLLHNGKIDINSKPGQGTILSISLPVAQS